MDGPARTTRDYYVAVNAFPIDTRPDLAAVPADGFSLEVAGLGSPLPVRTSVLSTFAYNERRTLETAFRPPADPDGDPDPDAPTEIVLRFLPSGTLVAYFVHELGADATSADLATLREDGARRWRAGLRWYGLLYDIVLAAADAGLVRLDPVSRLGMLTPADSDELPSRGTFDAEMAWRAWSTGNYLRVGGDGDTPLAPWPAEGDPTRLPSPHGVVERMFNNYFGWRLHAPGDGAVLPLLVDELEPIAYAISQRSVCASGAANVRAATEAFARGDGQHLSAGTLRRYVSLTRVSLQSGNEYLESSEKRARRIYEVAREDLDLDRHIADLVAGLEFVMDEVRGIHAENEERRDRRLADLVSVFTVIFGVSLVIDIILFVTAEQPVNLSPLTRWLIVSGSGTVLLGAFAYIRVR